MGDDGPSKVLAAISSDGGRSFSPPATIATSNEPETTMASVALDESGNPRVFWLQNSALQLAASARRRHLIWRATVAGG